MSENDGGYAFPVPAGNFSGGESWDPLYLGMSLRDYFAAHALAVIPGDVAEPASLARDAYAIADAMLAERSK